MNNNSTIVLVAVILLTSMVVFSGLSTPPTANFANFSQQVDNVYISVMNSFSYLKVKHALSGDYRTDEQIYIEIATGKDPGQYAVMGIDKVITGTSSENFKTLTSKNIQRIDEDKSINSIGMNLPYIRNYNNGWYITKDGRIFNSTGFVYNGKTYFNASVCCEKELSAESFSNSNRAEIIGKSILNDQYVVTISE